MPDDRPQSPVRQQRAPLRRCQRGFTMVELLVVMVLLVLIGSMVSRALITGFVGSAETAASANAEHMVAQALDQLRADLLKAVAPDRDPSKIREVSQLRRAIVDGAPVVSANPDDGAAPLDVYDVLVAQPAELHVRSDIDPDPGTECVRYRTVALGGSKHALRRQVFLGDTCSGRSRPEYDVLSPQSEQPIAFSYSLVCGRCPGRPPSCSSWSQTSVAGVQRNWIVGVHFDVIGRSERADTVARRRTSEVVSLRARESYEYRRALGC